MSMMGFQQNRKGPTTGMNPNIKTRPARRAPPRLARAGSNVFAELAKKTKFADPELIGHWPTIAGPEIASVCRPGRITGMRTGRTLEVIAANGAAAAEAQMRADELLMKVNRYLGANSVARITILQHNRGVEKHTKQPAQSLPEPDSASPLGKALSSFRSAVARRNNES